MRDPEELEGLYDELTKRIHAKDDEGVRRVFRELLDTGRSRQEIVSEIVRLIEAKSPNHGENSGKATGARRGFEASAQPESAPAQRASDTFGAPLTRAAESRPKEIDQAELGSSRQDERHRGGEVDEITCAPNPGGGSATSSESEAQTA